MPSLLYELFVKQYWRVFASQQLMFGISYYINNPTLIDVAWGFNHLIIGVGIASKGFTNFSNLFQKTNLIGLGLTSIWFIRLSGFIFYYRIINHYKDPRYKELANNRNMSEISFSFIQFQLQGILSTLTSIPLFYALKNGRRPLNLLNRFAIVTAILSILGEAIADYQLQRFKEMRKNNSEILRDGLFKKARHPNLFFELMFWTSIAAFGISVKNPFSLFAFSGPFILWGIVYFLTIPITTNHMIKTKPNYEKVIAETNMFYPF